jgi:hypothetical protein
MFGAKESRSAAGRAGSTEVKGMGLAPDNFKELLHLG